MTRSENELWSSIDEIRLWNWWISCESMPNLKENICALGDMVILENDSRRQREALPGWIAMLANHRTQLTAVMVLSEKTYRPIKNWLMQEIGPLVVLSESGGLSHRTTEYVQKAFGVLQ